MRAIVEERDATDEQRAIREINAGVYIGDAAAIRGALGRIDADNDQGEQYFTDVLGLLVAEGRPSVASVRADDPDDVLGCNDRVELAARRPHLNDRVLDDLMRSGVTVVDPLTTWVDVTVHRRARRRPASRAPSCAAPPPSPTGAVVGPDTHPRRLRRRRRARAWSGRTASGR